MLASSERPTSAIAEQTFALTDYDLAATLSSGQAFRWRYQDGSWVGVVAGRWVRLTQQNTDLHAQTTGAPEDWSWLRNYLQLEIPLSQIIQTFPKDEVMTTAVQASRGLRLLKQDHWECLASFILSSTKQIVQIQQCVESLGERFGAPLPVPPGFPSRSNFPSPHRLAECTESELRDCKLGFRAPYLLEAARRIAQGHLHLADLQNASIESARNQLMTLPGVGPKVADCVLLFAYGFPNAFPVDVWIYKAIQQLYFPKRPATTRQLQQFTQTYFGPHSGYAQQYLFHYMRTKIGRTQAL